MQLIARFATGAALETSVAARAIRLGTKPMSTSLEMEVDLKGGASR